MAALALGDLVAGVLDGDRTWVGRAITLVESSQPNDREQAQDLLAGLAPHAGNSHRIGITGVPGVGKSTFIDELGTRLTQTERRVAVLTVDPSSSVSGGSILGDKTRMPRLAMDPAAFIRPSPTSGNLGGVTNSTREAIVVVEAAGYDVVLVETVGVGQSETAVAEMVDFFLVLMLAGAGDDLQGIKKGVLELADMLAVNKADGDNAQAAATAAGAYRAALHLVTPVGSTWTPPVLTCSGLTGEGLDELWGLVEQHRRLLVESGEWDQRRSNQRVGWMWSLVEARLMDRFHARFGTDSLVTETEQAVRAGELSPPAAAARLTGSGPDGT